MLPETVTHAGGVGRHHSNILCKLGYENRAQYVARLLGSFAIHGAKETVTIDDSSVSEVDDAIED